jgi:SNF2 family DNA or RNA helicase
MAPLDDVGRPAWTTRTDLLPHQTDGVEKLSRSRVFALFMEMGTGKSRTIIELAHRKQAKISRIIWFCPVNIKPTIRHEILKHTHCTEADLYIASDKTRETKLPLDRIWYVFGIESMSSSARIIHAVARLIDENTMVIVDESTLIKGHEALRTMRITKLSERCRYRAILSGTPITQGYVDLFSQMRFLSPQILGYKSFAAFASEHIIYDKTFPDRITGYQDGKWISETVAPYVYQVTKADCLNLPDKLYDNYYFDLTDQQRGAYNAAKEDFLTAASRDDVWQLRREIYRLFTRLQTICCGYDGINNPVSLGRNRLNLCQSILEELTDTHVVVFARYHRNLDEIAADLAAAGRSCSPYDGRVTEIQRERNLDTWRRNGGYLLATPSTAGMGIDMTVASTMLFFANSFKFSERIQAEDRIHRIGQTKPVTYLSIYANAPVEERIANAIAAKRNALSMLRQEIRTLQASGEQKDFHSKLRDFVSAL